MKKYGQKNENMKIWEESSNKQKKVIFKIRSFADEVKNPEIDVLDGVVSIFPLISQHAKNAYCKDVVSQT